MFFSRKSLRHFGNKTMVSKQQDQMRQQVNDSFFRAVEMILGQQMNGKGLLSAQRI